MKIVLSHGYFLEEDSKEQNIMRPYPPLGILYVSSYLEQHHYPNEVFDTTFSSKEKFCDHLLETQPDVIGLYTNLMTKLNVLWQLRFIREHLPDTTVILGGPDTRHNAASYLARGASYLVLGEGEATMLELIEFIAQGQTDLRRIHGIAYLHENELIETAEREKIRDIDVLPVPNRKKIDLSLYLQAWKQHHGKNAISVSTMRGCPYTCKWCSRSVYGLSYRRRSPKLVADELGQLQTTYQPDSIWFVDDVFTISHVWLQGFRDELKKRNLKISYECITRADRMNERVVSLLRETGCFRVWIGAESGSQKVIDLMDRRVKVDQVREMIRLTQAHGIEAGTFIMLGYPGETERDIEETIFHLKSSNPDHFTITIAYPIKGTELFAEVEDIRSSQLDWETTTDRQIDFKRTYRRKYYDFAIKRVINEVNYFKAGSNAMKNIRSAKFKFKSLTAKTGMQWYRLMTLFR